MTAVHKPSWLKASLTSPFPFQPTLPAQLYFIETSWLSKDRITLLTASFVSLPPIFERNFTCICTPKIISCSEPRGLHLNFLICNFDAVTFMLLWNILFGYTTQYVPQWVVDFLRGVYAILFSTRSSYLVTMVAKSWNENYFAGS